MRYLILLQTLAAVCLSVPMLAQPTNVNVPAKTLESYVGRYELMPGFVLTIRKEADRLTAQATGQPRFGLTARSQTDFQASGVDASLTFVKEKDGKITQLVLHQNGDHEAQKISGDVPKDRVSIKLDAKTLDAYVGQYELTPEAIFTIRRDGENLRAQLTGQPSIPTLAESETNFFYTVVDAQLTFAKDAKGKVTELVLHQNGDKTAKKISDEVPSVRGPDLSKIPARDTKADARLVDLTGKYNALLTEQWHPDVPGLPAGANHLGSLPRGIQKLGGTDFEVRGVIQLTGTQADAAGASFPESQTGIKLGRKGKRLHFLQAAGWQAEEGKVIGKYVLHYAGGRNGVAQYCLWHGHFRLVERRCGDEAAPVRHSRLDGLQPSSRGRGVLLAPVQAHLR